MATLLNQHRVRFKYFDSTIQKIIRDNGSWYYQLKASKHYDELILQRVIKYKLKNLLPNHSSIYYNKEIVSSKSPYDKRIPDFILWSNSYDKWYVIEVELENHKIPHIRKQLDTFYHGDYSDADGITKYVKSKLSSINESDFKSMIQSRRPQVILMADGIDCTWRDEFAEYDCLFSTLQVYVDENDNFIHRIGGEFPQEFSKFTYCNLNKVLNYLEVHESSFFESQGFKAGDSIKIYFRGVADDWGLDIYEGNKFGLMYAGDLLPIDETHTRWKLILNNRNQIHLVK
ncbi:hypothetical protein [Marinoscillum sp.]|uniref:hypothetical protein n=1 Tax=Marinoscillum sp. TaxID=2024838 RepID=UPI003BAA449A